MKFIAKLSIASENVDDLEAFVHSNYQQIYDFLLSQSFESITANRDGIKSYITKNLQTFKKLNFNDKKIRMFIILLLDVSGRLSLLMPFQRLYKISIKGNCKLSNKIEAIAIFRIGITRLYDFNLRIESALNLLVDAVVEEEDSLERTTAVLISMYSMVVTEYGQYNAKGVIEFKNSFLFLLKNNKKYELFASEVMFDILKLDLSDYQGCIKNIQRTLAQYLTIRRSFSKNKYIIESESPYKKLLVHMANNFSSIQKLSAPHYQPSLNFDRVYHTLGRGTRILSYEEQLFSYMYSYGKMHNQKIKSALNYLDVNELNDFDSLSIVDWGCGQGIATMSLFDFLNDRFNTLIVKEVSLIEPSEIALKRAALHTLKLFEQVKLVTINSDFNSLSFENRIPNEKNSNIHLFSNTLDLDTFSMENLVKLIKASFTGINYFICVSPYITELKTSRLDSFVDSFKDENEFKLYGSIDERKGEWDGTNWSRVIRVFKVTL